MTPCVCVHQILRTCVRHDCRHSKSPDGGVCVCSYTPLHSEHANYTTTILKQIASSSVTKLTKTASRLLVDSEVYDAA